jgi:hypothetical protein
MVKLLTLFQNAPQSTYRLFKVSISLTRDILTSRNLQLQVLPVSQIQLRVIHDTSHRAPLRINRFNNTVTSNPSDFLKPIATRILPTQVDPESDDYNRRKNNSHLVTISGARMCNCTKTYHKQNHPGRSIPRLKELLVP